MGKKLIIAAIILGMVFVVIAMISIARGQIIIGDQQGGVVLTDPTPDVIGGNLSFNASVLTNYWEKAGVNAPPTANWDMGGFGFTDLGATTMSGDLDIGNNDINNVQNINFNNLGDIVNPRNIKNVTGEISFGSSQGKGTISFGNQFNIFSETNWLRFITGGLEEALYDFRHQGDIRLRFGGISGEGNLIYNETLDAFIFTEDLFVEGTINISNSHFIGNGSQISDVCLTDGSNCQTPIPDFTNVAYLNNTQTFTGNNTFNDTTIFKDEIIINQSLPNQNITWFKSDDGNSNCFVWRGTGVFLPQGICSKNNLELELFGGSIVMAFQQLSLGLSNAGDWKWIIKTSGQGTNLLFKGATGMWEYQAPISWLIDTTPTIIPSGVFPATNLSFDNIFGNTAIFNGIDVTIDGEFVFNDNINGCSGSEVVMGDGTCVENDTIGMEGGGSSVNYFSISTDVSSNSILGGVFPFSSNNYSTFSFVENAILGFTHVNETGQISPDADGIYRISFDWDGEIPDGSGMLTKIFLDDVNIYEAEVLNIANVGGSDKFGSSADIILSINAGQNLTFKLETGTSGAICPCGATSLFSTVTINSI